MKIVYTSTSTAEMAGGGIVDAKAGARAHLYEYKITPYFVFACIVGSLGGSLFGYDLGVSGLYSLSLSSFSFFDLNFIYLSSSSSSSNNCFESDVLK